MDSDEILTTKGMIQTFPDGSDEEEKKVSVVQVNVVGDDLQIHSNLDNKRDAVLLLLQAVMVTLEQEKF